MGFFSKTKNTFPWTELTSIDQLHALMEQSVEIPVLIFKHSTSCSISAMAINRFENKWTASPEACVVVYLDLLRFRSISNEIATITGVQHQSPQALLLKNKQVVYADSHNGIDAATIQSLL